MERKHQLEELLLGLDQAVDQLGRVQRMATAAKHEVAELDTEVDELWARVTKLRNTVRDELMKEMARGPKKPSKLRVL
jgi:hypothetical protein